MNDIEHQEKHAGTASLRTRGQTAVQLVKRATSRETRKRIRGMSCQQAVGIVQTPGQNAQQRHGHFSGVLQHLKKIWRWNRKNPGAFQRNDTCGAGALAQDTKFAKYLSDPQFAKEHFYWTIRH